MSKSLYVLAACAALLAVSALLAAPALANGIPTAFVIDQPAPVEGSVVSFSGTGFSSSSARIVVVPRRPVGAATTALPCYLGTPAYLAAADTTIPVGGVLSSTLTWNGAVQGSYTAYLLQGSCQVQQTKPGLLAQTDQRIVASVNFDVADATSVPALSGGGLIALAVALAAAGWALLSRLNA